MSEEPRYKNSASAARHIDDATAHLRAASFDAESFDRGGEGSLSTPLAELLGGLSQACESLRAFLSEQDGFE